MKRLSLSFSLLALTATFTALPCKAAEMVSSFYGWTASISAASGTLLRKEPLKTSWLPADTGTAFKILYSSTDGMNAAHKVPVSGYILFPAGPVPKEGWPLVIWAHGTTGVADICAPSWMGPRPRDQAYLNTWLKRGFAVVASDYQGLGTPGTHPYLLYRPEAYSLLDAARTVLEHYPTIQNKILIVGQSQGAGAALAATWAFPQYAPDLKVKGAVLTGLVATIHQDQRSTSSLTEKRYTTVNAMDPAFATLRLAGTDQAIHPEVDLATLLSENGKKMLVVAQNGCLHDLFDAAKKFGIKTGKELLSADITSYDQDMDHYFELPNGHVTVPVLLGTGLADAMAGTNGQYEAATALCRAGTIVQWHKYPGITHNGAVNYSLPDSETFMRNIMAGHPIASSCQYLTPPGPIQQPLTGIPFNE
ncbi:alpha/beta hydrolase [Gluconobacter cerinus]|uniref:alpha/beta hydrolase n=1 Tax=Gluconobacter cerinus TaxID=38307 RepID=UPI001B8D5739|nr:lipase family protein [Gluconobacter cerinus]MBS1072483.1 alpha/beta hydrolase [Gluconobacter cerinus]MCW2266183.1 pimeloyl-ACP methyl ester carboxylesterase [Gluconobacter cerinus]